MNARTLRHFLNLAETLHFGRAAEAGHVSPSALSRAIQRLEAELGIKLFERSNRQVALTHAGCLFRDYAADALADWDTMRNRILAEATELHGEVSLYCSVTASYSFLFDILARVRRRHPRIEIKLHTGDPEDAISRVLSGSEDIAIAARPSNLQAGLAFRPIAVSPLVFIAARDTGQARGVSGNEWEGIPIILNERGLARERADRWFRQIGVSPSIYAQVSGNEAIVSMVSLGFGIGVVPRIVLDNSPLKDSVEVLDVGKGLAPYEVGLVTRRRRLASPLIQAFWGTLDGQVPSEEEEAG
ncbi:MAG: HTH-type transcriptional activator IlvY [Xanthomonadales bacterium]|nr:HTH-type transcriptional activator IlvY [Gammaproteobacteria bacterium]MBT8056379.1 HTH-type transcriptional activator IlvY [Gammaproteobacteria bacterium]NNL04817.1 HTH-type transcriptional activator IlvY [Xanthomonadales bacterium]